MVAEDIGHRAVDGSGPSVVSAEVHGAVVVVALEEDSEAASEAAVALVVEVPAGHGNRTEI